MARAVAAVSWIRLDDGWHSHPKTLRCSLAARGLWASCLGWSAQQLTDGFIPTSVPRMMDPKGTRSVGQLVAAGFWEPVEGGWQIHDYLDYNSSREQILAEREAQHEAKVRAGLASAKARREGKGGTAQPPGRWPSLRTDSEQPVRTGSPVKPSWRRSESFLNPARSEQPTSNSEQTPNPIPSAPALANASVPRARDSNHDGTTTTASGADPRPEVLPRNTAYVSAGEDVDSSATSCPKCHLAQIRQQRRKSDGAPFVSCPDRGCNWTADGHLADYLKRPHLRQTSPLGELPDPDTMTEAPWSGKAAAQAAKVAAFVSSGMAMP